jgi:hypothetical protein
MEKLSTNHFPKVSGSTMAVSHWLLFHVMGSHQSEPAGTSLGPSCGAMRAHVV